ncbi:MAG TPA: biotin/lipoyl-containing protein [Usitatibacteraceae bacterium]|nr:biotin/lipoyl-containing protein [Usitatibacteraceae bacterium]
MRKPRSPRVAAKAPAKAPAAPAPGPRAPTYDDLLAIAKLVEAGSRFTEFRLRSGDIEVEFKRLAPAAPASAAPAAAPAAALPAAAAASPAVPDLPAGTSLVRSPMAGTAYRASAPSAPAFVEPGDRVEPDTIVCIVEVMKLMNSVTADVAGVVTHVLFANAQSVEPGQALVAIRPAP